MPERAICARPVGQAGQHDGPDLEQGLHGVPPPDPADAAGAAPAAERQAVSLGIWAAKAAEMPLLLNLGGDSPAEVFEAIRGYPRLIVQTSIEEGNAAEAQRLAGRLQDAPCAEWAIITAGRPVPWRPAGAHSSASLRSVLPYAMPTAPTRPSRQAYIWPDARLAGTGQPGTRERFRRIALRAGSHDEPMPGLAEMRTFMQVRERVIGGP